MTPSPPRKPTPWRLALVLALPLAAACDEDSSVLDVNFDRLDVRDIDWEQIDTDFVFTVDNPNPVQIALSRFDYALSFSGVEWLSGNDPDGLVIGSTGTSEVALPTLIGFASLYEMVQADQGEDAIPFALEGSFGFDTPWGELDIPYAAEGDFPALRTPKFSYDRIKVADYDLTGATLDVDLLVDNEHGSNLWFTDFDYDLKLEGSSVASGLIDDLGEAAGAGTTTLTIPVDIDWVDAGTGLYDALTSGGSVDVGIAAGTNVDTPFGLVPLDIDESGKVSVDL